MTKTKSLFGQDFFYHKLFDPYKWFISTCYSMVTISGFHCNLIELNYGMYCVVHFTVCVRFLFTYILRSPNQIFSLFFPQWAIQWILYKIENGACFYRPVHVTVTQYSISAALSVCIVIRCETCFQSLGPLWLDAGHVSGWDEKEEEWEDPKTSSGLRTCITHSLNWCVQEVFVNVVAGVDVELDHTESIQG